jgi:RNA polymerase sigma factor (sigma-70 family)
MDIGSDNQIMLQVKSGDIDKLGLLFERHKNPLYGYFYRRTTDRETSEDLVQTVFLRILKYRERYAGEGQFTVWMYRIARNVLCDAWKKKSGKNTVPLDPDRIENATETVNTEMYDERLVLLQKALDSLNEDQREAILLSRFQGLRYSEIGKILGCSEGAVKVRIFRALARLKELYQKLDE